MAKSAKGIQSLSSTKKKAGNVVKAEVREIKEEENNSGSVEEDTVRHAPGKAKRKAEEGDESLPAKKSKLINDGFCLYVGNLNASKTIVEIREALADFFTSHSLLFQHIRVDSKKKFAYVDFQSEEDLVKALGVNEKQILGQKMRLDKARVQNPTQNDKKAEDARTLFLKNIPFAATKEDLMKVFVKAVRIRFPGRIGSPSKGIAFIEFETEAIAEKVLEQMQGTDIQGRIVVIDFLGEKSQNPQNTKVTAGTPPNNQLLVTNLAHTAKEDDLKKIFLKAVWIKTVKKKKRPTGHCVIQFASVEDATKAMESAINQEICGKVIQVKFSPNTPNKEKIDSGSLKTLMVKNLAKETSVETLKSAFEGAVEVRIIKNTDTGESRGFGFVVFESTEVCKDVKEAMGDICIDGSRVKLVFAKPQNEQGTGGDGPGFHKGFRGKPKGWGQAGGSRGGRGLAARGNLKAGKKQRKTDDAN